VGGSGRAPSLTWRGHRAGFRLFARRGCRRSRRHLSSISGCGLAGTLAISGDAVSELRCLSLTRRRESYHVQEGLVVRGHYGDVSYTTGDVAGIKLRGRERRVERDRANEGWLVTMLGSGKSLYRASSGLFSLIGGSSRSRRPNNVMPRPVSRGSDWP
jgi:hypothetical protein